MAQELTIVAILDPKAHDAPGPFLRLQIGGEMFDVPADRVGKLIDGLREKEREIRSAEMDLAASKSRTPSSPVVFAE